MHVTFSRRVVIGSSSQLTKLVTKQPSQGRHFLSYPLPSRLSSSPATSSVSSLLSRSEKIHGFFASTLGNTNLKLKFGNFLESRVGFFSSQLPSHGFESRGFTGFQKRGWKSWFNGANGVVFGLVIANAAVFTMWQVSDRKWMAKNFVLSKFSFTSGRIHTLITSGFSHVVTSQLIWNMVGLCYFGTRIARTLGPHYLLKIYFAGALGSSVFYLSNHVPWAISFEGQRAVPKDKVKVPFFHLGAHGSVFAITLLDMIIFPKITTYFEFMLRVPAMAGIAFLVLDIKSMAEGKNNTVSLRSSQLGGIVVAAMAWARLRKGRF
ncbi:Rhomboid-like protein 16 [Cardamine amara subsp. amara]|uniref:Rhomboid-like protein 16 n=1 Tax=Cardamine amara subsp. amara TaxID=228776 RepID=A0ABD1BDY8_CARAN